MNRGNRILALIEELKEISAEQEAQIEEITALNEQLKELSAEKQATIDELVVASEVHDALGSGDWQMAFDDEGNMSSCTWSDHFRRMLGFESLEDFPDELESWSDRLHPEDKGQVMACYWATVNDFTGATTYDVRYRLLNKAGAYRWYRATGRLTRHGDGRPRKFYGMFLDINDQVLYERRLEDSVAEQEAQIEEISALNRQLEDASAEQEAQIEEITALNEQLEEVSSERQARIDELVVASEVHFALGSGDWQMAFDDEGNMSSCAWSDHFRRMLGFESLEDFPDELESWSDRLHPEDKPATLESYWATVNDFTGATTYDVRYRLMNKAGAYRWYRATGRLTRHGDGRPRKFYGMFLDIDEQVRYDRRLEDSVAEQEAQIEEISALNEQLKEVSAQRQATIDELVAASEVHHAIGSGDWQMTFDEAGEMSACNWSDDFRRMLGFESLEDFPDELESWSDRLHPEDKPATLESYWATVNDFTGATTYDVRYRLLNKAGAYRWYRATGRLTRRADGRPRKFYGMFLDIDEQVRYDRRLEDSVAEQEAQIEEINALNEQLEERQAQLEEATSEQEAQIEEIGALNKQLEQARDAANAANEAKSSFLFNMSHDIRTPMNAIIGFTELLRKHQDDSERRESYLAKIDGASKQLLSIINNVLDMARIESGSTELEEVPWTVGQACGAMRDMFDVLMEEKGLHFTQETRVEHRFVYADPTKLNQVLSNLLSNAWKYTEPGGSVSMFTEELECDREGYTLIRTTVTDTGIGMDADYLPRLFEEFSREANTTESKIEGTGLGMPIVKKLVDFMGGTIDVKSEKGVGTTFAVTLPHRIAEGVEFDDSVREVDPAIFEGKRILLAEDNDLNAEIAMEILGEAGFVIERAENGSVAVRMFEESEHGYYDVILMDIQMPYMNGYEATHAIREMKDEAKAGIPILAMTANAFEEDRREALRNGMDGHIAKPINVQELMRSLAGVLE